MGNYSPASPRHGHHMDKKWIAEERKLWDAVHAWPAVTADTKAGRKIARRGASHKLVSQEEATARSWQAYRAWITH